jgi:phosphate transport system permease protein
MTMRLKKRPSSAFFDVSARIMTGACAALLVLMFGFVMADVVKQGAPSLSWELVSQAPREGMTKGGILPAIVGTTLLTLLMTVMTVPAGVLTAIYLTEYATRTSRIAHAVRLCVKNLAGVPSIVYGLFGLGFFVAMVGRGVDSIAFQGRSVYGRPCMIWASATLAILTLPVVVVATEEALLAVPRDTRDASIALGATRLQTLVRVVLPQAAPGILTGAILAIGRGAGEVAPILFTGAAYYLPELPTHLNDPFMNLGYHVYVLATQSPNVDKTRPLLYGTVLVLLGISFTLSSIAFVIRTRMRRHAH